MPVFPNVNSRETRNHEISRLETAFKTDNKNLGKEQRYGLAKDFMNILNKNVKEACSAANISTKTYTTGKNNGGQVSAAKTPGRRNYLNEEQIDAVTEVVRDNQLAQKALLVGNIGEYSMGQAIVDEKKKEVVCNSLSNITMPSRNTMTKYTRCVPPVANKSVAVE